MISKIMNKFSRMSIRFKLILAFTLTAFFMFMINLFMYVEVNNKMELVDQVYSSNVDLNDLLETLEETQQSVYEYLNTKSSASLENYYRMEQQFQNQLSGLNRQPSDNKLMLREKNIANMSDTYLTLLQDTVQAKRGRNVEKYKEGYEKSKELYQYINNWIYELNNETFKMNSTSYQLLVQSLKYMEIVSSTVLICITLINMLVLLRLARNIVEPLGNLAQSANQVAAGNFDVPMLQTDSEDEVAIVTNAFNTMIASIRQYIIQIRNSMEKEQAMKEQELLMETHLKDAQLKYLQAQINPHFLFNSLNAGAQLAMMEDAEQTCLFIERMADFFRYNVKKMSDDATLGEEVESVDNYIYILNVRFAGDIHFSKNVDSALLFKKIPSMIIQPIVENAVNYGIRDIEWEGVIVLSIFQENDYIRICVQDNGKGMSKERIQEVYAGEIHANKSQKDSTGVGLNNVINRLQLYYGEKNLFRIESDGTNQGTKVTISIPLSEEEQRCIESY
ncbi:MAG: histidine kinase [Lachnospiraceae bacterium]|nr:histidine kinase [Lachnospiraceae bacterium]MDD3614674.1 histidine kinase [Lachnospiraceae bacterium]